MYNAVAREVYIAFFDITLVFYNFEDENGNVLDIKLYSTQDEEFWLPNEEYVITLNYMGVDLEIPFTINPASHWVEQEDYWYYIVDDVAVKGWVNDNGKSYYFDNNGVCEAA